MVYLFFCCIVCVVVGEDGVIVFVYGVVDEGGIWCVFVVVYEIFDVSLVLGCLLFGYYGVDCSCFVWCIMGCDCVG